MTLYRPWPGQAALAADTINFERDIQPLLADNCLACHGKYAESRAADLRLVQREGASTLEISDPEARLPVRSLRESTKMIPMRSCRPQILAAMRLKLLSTF